MRARGGVYWSPERRRLAWSAFWLTLAGLVGAALSGGLIGCASVKSYEWKYLADPIMDRAERLAELDREQKWLEAREGSIGGASGAGGGCACK